MPPSLAPLICRRFIRSSARTRIFAAWRRFPMPCRPIASWTFLNYWSCHSIAAFSGEIVRPLLKSAPASMSTLTTSRFPVRAAWSRAVHPLRSILLMYNLWPTIPIRYFILFWKNYRCYGNETKQSLRNSITGLHRRLATQWSSRDQILSEESLVECIVLLRLVSRAKYASSEQRRGFP